MKVCLDSRLIKKGEYFVPVKGDNFDGHDFIDQAKKRGAAGIIEEGELYEIASKKLEEVKPTVIGVAGSVGKSTFRSYLVQILNRKYKVLDGYLNTKLGLAKVVVNELSNHEIVVAELGIDRIGEMKEITNFIKPNFSVITKLEKEHLQFFKSLETVVRENIVAVSNSKEKMGYLNAEDTELVKDYVTGLDIKYFQNTPRPRGYPTSFAKATANRSQQQIFPDSSLRFPEHDQEYLTCIHKIARERFDFTDKEFEDALGSLQKPKGRLNIIKGKNGSIIIDDSYNAVCDESVIKGVQFAERYVSNSSRHSELDSDSHNLVIILSQMRETGDSEKEQHQKVAEYLNTVDYKKLFIVGDKNNLYGQYLTKEFTGVSDFKNFEYPPKREDIIYIKGSQFYRLEKVVENLMANPEKAKDLLVRQDMRWE